MSALHHKFILALGLQPLAYRFAEAFYSLRFRLSSMKTTGNPILVYQMGKVGSSSVTSTLHALVPQIAVYHVHHLTNDGIKDNELHSIAAKRAFPGPGYYHAKQIQQKLLKHAGGKRWRLIALTRDPVARNLSGFFQRISLWSADAIRRFSTGERKSLFDELLGIFLSAYPHHKPHDWFNAELENVFGIDVYETKFDRASGYGIYHGVNADLLIIRMEDISSCYRKALYSFLHTDTSHQPLLRANESGQKEYSELYREFLGWISLPEEYLEDQYATRYSRHFYSAAELKLFRQKWLTQK